ncbi:MAG: efflux RND transporter periplasmic adaptor subunit [Rhodospirillales bacterium]|nr:efflux RND transporter periplasmic adaptor subunit [Rhodospirillales bacterium]
MPQRTLFDYLRYLMVAVFAFILFTTASQAQDAEQEITPVGVNRVIEEPLNQTMSVIGRLVARQSGVVAARTSGPVGEFNAQIGDRVTASQIVAVLIKDAHESRRDLWLAEVAKAKAAIGTSQAELKLREQELKRLHDLEQSAAFSQARLDDKAQEVAVAKSAISELRAALRIAEANLRLAEIDLYNVDIRAPYHGVITKRHTEIGAFVRAGDPLVTLIDDSTLEIDADVPTERIAGLTFGVTIPFQYGDGTTGTATVRAIIPDENPLTRTRSVRFTAILGSDVPLAVNQSITLKIPVGARRMAITVHKDAVLNRGGRRLVYLALDGKAVIRPVELGEAVGTRFEVLQGLKPGDLTIVRGNERLFPDQHISFDDPAN